MSAIPRLIHRIWLDDPMPEEFAVYGRQWAALHPGWEVRDWRSSAELPPMASQALFEAAQEIIPRDWKRFQSDLLRFELLQRFGGLYVDTDCQPLRPFDDLMDPDTGAFAGWSANTNELGRPITQAVVAAQPHHPFVAAVVAGFPDAVRDFGDRSLAQLIGPWHVTRTYEAMDHPPLTVHPPDLFYPQPNHERDAGEDPDLDGAYCWHRWANTRDRRHGGVPR